MLSTLANYKLLVGDMTKTLARVEAQGNVARDAAYYRDKIGTVRTVDDLMGDYRLYSYALKAHGLSEQVSSPGFVRKILESDLADPQSFANRLSDPRYRAFATAFDFQTASAATGIQSQAQTDRLVEAYSEHLVRGGANAAQKAETFQTRIARVGSVDELLADPDLFAMVAKVAGLDPAFASKSFMRAVLTGGDIGATTSTGLAYLARAFDFAPDGSLKSGGAAQTPAQTAEFVSRYFSAVGQSTSPQAAAFDARHFEKAALSAARVEDLVDDPTVLRVLRLSAGLPDVPSSADVLVNLISLPADDPKNPLARLTGTDATSQVQREKLLAVRAAFDFSHGAGTAPVTDPQRIAGLVDRFHDAHPKADPNQITLQTNSFRVALSKMDTVNDLLSRDFTGRRQALDYVLKAFDIDPSTQSLSKIRQVLTSDPSDPNSFVRSLKDERYERLAAAFNFGPDGKAAPERLAQSVRASQETATLYAKSFGADQSEATKADIRKATVNYLEAVGGIRSLDDILSNRTVLDYALKAHGLDGEKLSTRDISKLLTSDMTDPDSFARSFGDKRYTDFAGSFRFQADGRIGSGGSGAQDSGDVFTTQNLYLLNMLEEQAGETNEGTRLALYFLRKSPGITNAFSILADKALFEVVRTALGLPQQMSQLDIDRQAKILESRLDFSDFKDAKSLDRFIGRFATLYDMNNGAGGASDPILLLFGGGGNSSGIAGLF